MSLPELEWQILYGRFAWAIVLAALAAAAWPRSKRMAGAAIVFLMVGAALLALLPDEASPAYWLGLALQWPSGLLVGLSLCSLYRNWKGPREQPAMPACLAFPIALAGTVLYLDAIGLVALGIYYVGFGPIGAPLMALAMALACAAAAMLGRLRLPALALLLATTLFMLLRLPTGNLWDALLDPLLWAWSLASLAGAGWRRWRLRRGEALRHGRMGLAGARTVEDIGKSA